MTALHHSFYKYIVFKLTLLKPSNSHISEQVYVFEQAELVFERKYISGHYITEREYESELDVSANIL